MLPKDETNIHEAFRIFLDDKEVTSSNPFGVSLDENVEGGKYLLVDRKMVEEEINKMQLIIDELKYDSF